MIDETLLDFQVLAKPEKDLFKKIQSNAKFKTISDVLKTKVGINNFYNFSICLKSTIVLRDIVLNSQFVSGWARSSQVLNDNDSKFSVYKFLSRSKDETNAWIKQMEELEAAGHSMDNMRALIYLDSIGDYAISIDILHLLYLTIVLDCIHENLDQTHDDFKLEVKWFIDKFQALLLEYDVQWQDFKNSMRDAAFADFPAINGANVDIANIAREDVYSIAATYSVIGQIWRHRTLLKQYSAKTYSEEVEVAKMCTKLYNFNDIGMHKDIADLVRSQTEKATNIYGLCQGTITPFKFTGTVGAIHKALSQRTCFINDSPQFKEAFEQFSRKYPKLLLLPPCKLNTTSTNSCYVGYVNESRLRGEEKTQVACPIWCKSQGKLDAYKTSLESPKTQWYLDNLDLWKNVCK